MVAENKRSFLVDDILTGGLVKIEPAKLRAVQVGPTKTIWHVFHGHDELIRTASNDGSAAEIAVFIGQLGGKLAVVR
jgi:hypothetical protein